MIGWMPPMRANADARHPFSEPGPPDRPWPGQAGPYTPCFPSSRRSQAFIRSAIAAS
jgi:hypothetical protein